MRPYAAAVFVVILSVASGASPAAPAADSVIYVARRGWHIDIGFQAADLEPPLDSLRAEFPEASALFFGFGDRRYLDSRNHRGSALLAALWPGRGLILATALNAPARDAFGPTHLVALQVTDGVARAVQAFIWLSMQGYESYRAGPYPGSRYFTATPTYSGFYTCNTWAAQALASGGLPIRATATVFASQLWRQVRRTARREAKKRSTVTRATVDAQPGASAP